MLKVHLSAPENGVCLFTLSLFIGNEVTVRQGRTRAIGTVRDTGFVTEDNLAVRSC
jgi:hypothetical protein